jgi:hypothetical protein
MHLSQLVRISAEVFPMQSLWRASLVAGLAAAMLAVLAASPAVGQEKSKSVNFKTSDGVTLQGAFYAAAGKKKDAVVMLLHDFDAKKGGSSTQDGWGELAKALQADGYSVLSFDFRGFGDSKDVNKDVFWKQKHNDTGIKHSAAKPPETIDHKNFSSMYYAYLVNDIAAAKAYLDRANDRKEVNSSNVILIGAGQGATLGSMWVANEAYRRKDKNPKENLFAAPNLADPECNDIAGCVWLTISPKIEARNTNNAMQRTWLPVAARTNKIPMAFYFGKGDSKADTYNTGVVKTVKGNLKNVQVTARPVEGANLAGSKLLDRATNKMILKDLAAILDSRGTREPVTKKVEDSAFYYQLNAKGGRAPTINKKAGEEVPPVNLSYLLQ